jgi:hypothetical protein
MVKIPRRAHFGIFPKIRDFASFSFLQQTNQKLNWIQIFIGMTLPSLASSKIYSKLGT